MSQQRALGALSKNNSNMTGWIESRFPGYKSYAENRKLLRTLGSIKRNVIEIDRDILTFHMKYEVREQVIHKKTLYTITGIDKYFMACVHAPPIKENISNNTAYCYACSQGIVQKDLISMIGDGCRHIIKSQHIYVTCDTSRLINETSLP